MKGRWAVICVAAMFAGCASSQPATNPFLRTTVAPPATGQGIVVVPGEAYSPGIAGQAAPLSSPPITPGGPPPAVFAPPPAMAPQPVAPPPMAAPPKDPRYVPPGGTFQYNQSSLDPPHRSQRLLPGSHLASHVA